MYDMQSLFGYVLQACAQERWKDWETLKLGDRQPGEVQVPIFLVTGKGTGLSIEIRIGGERNQKIESERLMGYALVGEELLDHVQQAHNSNIGAQLLAHLACQRLCRRFAHLGTSAGRVIKIFVRCVLEQDGVVVGSNRRHAIREAGGILLESNHRAVFMHRSTLYLRYCQFNEAMSGKVALAELLQIIRLSKDKVEKGST